jgi:Tol biopolymer transport system component
MYSFWVTLIAALTFLACRATQPTQPWLSPAVFAPDGTAIVLSIAGEEGTCFLYKADIATGAMHRLTQATDGCEFDPAFSQDGKQVAFMRASRSGAYAALIVANADGTGPHILVSSEADNLKPVFVPQANRIVFLRSSAFEHHSPVVDNSRHKFGVFAADLANGRVTPLTQQPIYIVSQIAVSTDGQQLLLSVFDDSADHFTVSPIDKPEGAGRIVRPQPFAYVTNATWLPDGHSLLFSGGTAPPGGGNFDYNVYRLTLASGAVEQLTHLTGLMDGFSASLDGTKAVILPRNVYYILDLRTHHLTPVPLKLTT